MTAHQDIKDNFSIVINNIADFADRLELHILGISTEQLLNSIGKECLPDNVIVHGRVSHEECIEKVKDSDFQIFLRPDNLVTRAGFPTKLGESFACGTLVITNLSSNIGDYLVDGENGFVIGGMSDDFVIKTMEKAAALQNSELSDMKLSCENYSGFDYKEYIQIIDNWLNTRVYYGNKIK